MIKLSEKQQKIITVILEKGALGSSGIHAEMTQSGEAISLVTVKRALSEMAGAGILAMSGSGRSTIYELTTSGRIFADIDARRYCSTEPDQRYGRDRYDFSLLREFPSDLFTEDELTRLNDATAEYERRTKDLPAALQKKELERLIIELSWKSSRIEGNTYTLLDTEKLILENKQAPGHDKKEAVMILNHKDAFDFVHQNSSQFKTITRKNLEELHAILVKDLSVDLGLRAKPVGILGSRYQPLDNIHQIREAVENLGKAVSRMSNTYEKALLALLGIGYVQPFNDGNKRTSRLMANAVLLAHSRAPLSYRSIDENEYREAMLVFYELNSILPFKEIFIGQYVFAAQHYGVK